MTKQLSRSDKTKHALWEALFHLLFQEKRDFHTISVHKICQQAELHRTTFYKYFTDKSNLFIYGFDKMLEKRNREPLLARVFEPFRCTEKLHNIELLRVVLQAQQEPELITKQALFAIVQKDICALAKVGIHFPLPPSLTAQYLMSTLLTVDCWQRLQPKPLSSRQLDKYFQKIVHSHLIGISSPLH